MHRAKAWPSRRHRLLPVLTLLLAALVLTPWLAVAQTEGELDSIEVYISPEFGYLFWWDSREWGVDDHTVEPGSDQLRLVNATSAAVIRGYASPGVTVEDCLREALSRIENNPTLVRFESLAAPGLTPESSISPNGLVGWVSLVVGFDSPEGQATYVARETCASLVPGERLLYLSEWMLAEAFNDGQAVGGVQNNLIPPRSTWTFTDQSPLPDGPHLLSLAYRPTLLLDGSGNELGMLPVRRYYDCRNEDNAEAIVIENSGVRSLTVDPAGFFAVTEDDEIVTGPEAQWVLPPAEGSGPIDLIPGERALLRLEFPITGFSHLFHVEQRVVTDLGGNGGCGAGAAAPTIIDIDE